MNLPSIREMFPGRKTVAGHCGSLLTLLTHPGYLASRDTEDNERLLLKPCRFQPYAAREISQSPSPLSSPSPQPEVPSVLPPAAVPLSSHRRRKSQPAFRVNAQPPATSTITETSVLVNHSKSS